MEFVTKCHERAVERALPGKKINVGATPQYFEEHLGRVGALRPLQNDGIAAIRQAWIGGARPVHDHAEARGIEAGNHLLHGEVLRVGIVLVGERRREDCDEALGSDGINPLFVFEFWPFMGPLYSSLKKCFSRPAFPQRLEAAADSAAVSARVELVPFPVLPSPAVFPQPLKLVPFPSVPNCRVFQQTVYLASNFSRSVRSRPFRYVSSERVLVVRAMCCTAICSRRLRASAVAGPVSGCSSFGSNFKS